MRVSYPGVICSVTECLYYSIHPEGSFKVTCIKPTMEVNLTISGCVPELSAYH